jgi:hypothetical protein
MREHDINLQVRFPFQTKQSGCNVLVKAKGTKNK